MNQSDQEFIERNLAELTKRLAAQKMLKDIRARIDKHFKK
mgnify:FL=1